MSLLLPLPPPPPPPPPTHTLAAAVAPSESTADALLHMMFTISGVQSCNDYVTVRNMPSCRVRPAYHCEYCVQSLCVCLLWTILVWKDQERNHSRSPMEGTTVRKPIEDVSCRARLRPFQRSIDSSVPDCV